MSLQQQGQIFFCKAGVKSPSQSPSSFISRNICKAADKLRLQSQIQRIEDENKSLAQSLRELRLCQIESRAEISAIKHYRKAVM